MEHKHDVEALVGVDRSGAPCQREGESLLLDEAADQLHPRPWQHDANSPSAVDLTQYALWRASDLSTEELLGALSLLPAARAEVESAEVGLLFVARNEGLTWAQIADAMGFRSPQACQQYVNRLSAKHGRRP